MDCENTGGFALGWVLVSGLVLFMIVLFSLTLTYGISVREVMEEQRLQCDYTASSMVEYLADDFTGKGTGEAAELIMDAIEDEMEEGGTECRLEAVQVRGMSEQMGTCFLTVDYHKEDFMLLTVSVQKGKQTKQTAVRLRYETEEGKETGSWQVDGYQGGER